MRWLRFLFLMSGSLLFVAVGVKTCEASSLSQWQYRQYFLDRGFLEREVNLNIPDLALDVSFTATDIPYTGVLHVLTTLVDKDVSDLGYKRFGPDYQFQWTTNAPQKPEKVWVRLSHEACGLGTWHCAVEQVYQGKTELLKPSQVLAGSALVRVSMGAKLRLVQVEGWMSEGYASWYAYKNCNCAASPDFPKGSYVKVTRVSDPSKIIIVRINDFGPERDIFPDRVIDLDKIAFAALGPLGAGVMKVKVEPMPEDYSPAVAVQTPVITQASLVPEFAKSDPDWEL